MAEIQINIKEKYMHDLVNLLKKADNITVGTDANYVNPEYVKIIIRDKEEL